MATATALPPPVFERRATVTRVVDGDTLQLAVDVGLDLSIAMTVRLAGINCPELPSGEGRAAAAFTQGWIYQYGPLFALRTVKDRREKYGRYLADLLPLDSTPDWERSDWERLKHSTSLCTALLDAGHAVRYPS